MTCVSATDIKSVQLVNIKHNITPLALLDYLTRCIPSSLLKHLIAISEESQLSRGRCVLHCDSHESMMLLAQLLDYFDHCGGRVINSNPLQITMCRSHQCLLSSDSSVPKDSVLYCQKVIEQILQKREMELIDLTAEKAGEMLLVPPSAVEARHHSSHPASSGATIEILPAKSFNHEVSTVW